MQPEEVVAALKRVPAEVEQLQSAASRYENTLVFPTLVVETLEEPPPSPVLMYLVEDPQVCGRELATQDALAVRVRIPVQITLMRTGQAPRQRGLSHLARSRHEYHLAFQIAEHLVGVD